MTTYKVLPFDAPAGHVGGHEIKSHNPAIEYVEFERWDEVSKMSLKVLVHWTCWTQYTKKSWPNGGTAAAVILRDGSRLRAEGRYARHSDWSYERAPIVCRDMIRVTNWHGDPLLEVVGAMDYLHGRIKEIPCPWERDNAIFRARFEKPEVEGCGGDAILDRKVP